MNNLYIHIYIFFYFLSCKVGFYREQFCEHLIFMTWKKEMVQIYQLLPFISTFSCNVWDSFFVSIILTHLINKKKQISIPNYPSSSYVHSAFVTWLKYCRYCRYGVKLYPINQLTYIRRYIYIYTVSISSECTTRTRIIPIILQVSTLNYSYCKF